MSEIHKETIEQDSFIKNKNWTILESPGENHGWGYKPIHR